jgi:hypothetical protein
MRLSEASQEVLEVVFMVVSGVLKDLIRRIVWWVVIESENRVTKMRIKGQQDDGG